MKPALEAIRLQSDSSSLHAFERVAPAFEWNWHYHPEFELTLILKGSGTRLVGDHTDSYAPKDLVLLGENLPHTWVSEERPGPRLDTRNRALVIQFHSHALPEPLLALPEFSGIGGLLKSAARGLRFTPALAKMVEPAMKEALESAGLRRWSKLLEILEILAKASPEVLASPSYSSRQFQEMGSRLGRVMAHLENNFRADVTMEEMARVAGLSPGAFSRFFKKLAHRTFVSYRNACRIREACRLLAESDLSITAIAFDCGFNNLANFNRRFLEEKGMTPRQYRRIYNP